MSVSQSRLVALLWIVLVALAPAGCRSTFPVGRVPAPGPEARARFEEAESLRRAGLFAEAHEKYRAAIDLAPDYTAAHRQVQNRDLAQCRRAEVVERYTEAVDRNPRSPVFMYLYGRLLDDPREQRAAFLEAIRLDPGYVWAHYGLGYTYQREGRFEPALDAYGEAVAIDSSHYPTFLRMAEVALAEGRTAHGVTFYIRASHMAPTEAEIQLSLSGVMLAQEKYDSALPAAMRAIKLAPWSSAGFRLVDRILPHVAGTERLLDIADVLDDLAAATEMEREPSAYLFLTRARVARALGDPYHARMLLIEGLERGGDVLDFAEELRATALLMRDYPAALDAWRMRVPDALVLHPDNLWRDRFVDLLQVLESGADVGHLERARAFQRVGWLDGAAQEYRLHLMRDPGDEERWDDLDALELHRRFVREVAGSVKQSYRASSEGEGAGSLRRFLDRVHDAADRILGRDLRGGVRFDHYAMIGSLMTPTLDAPSDLSAQFDRYGQLLVVGKQLGGPPEMWLGYPVEVRSGLDVDLGRAQRNPTFTRVLTRDIEVPSYKEYRGARIAGVALGEWMLMDFDVLLDWQRSARVGVAARMADPQAFLDLPLERHDPTMRRSGVGDTACVAEKLYLRAYQEWAQREYSQGDPFAADWQMLLGVVHAHEYGHLIDFHRFVPLTSNLFKAIGVFFELGLSRSRVEEFLEENAQIVALAIGPNPHAALAHTVTPTSQAGQSPPHSAAYHRVTREFVRYLEEHLEDYPALDPAYELVQQLHRLEGEEIRLIAQELGRRRGLLHSDR